MKPSRWGQIRLTRPPLRPTGVEAVVHDACVRCGMVPVGAHRLRHTAATGMLRAAGSLPEIAQVLRHRRLETTAIYAKVDRAALRPLAPPWPGSAR
ncbi:MAG TPA: tyrosine-type recombinase/integrase [Kineosporiaceae bacterium]|nr:tyrosine-type recombinase/integrase [Kineosporiaceae bacterium]